MRRFLLTISSIASIIVATAQQSSVSESFVIRKNKKLVLPAANRQFFSYPSDINTIQYVQPATIRFDTLLNLPNTDFQLDPLSPRINIEEYYRRELSNHRAWLGLGNRFSSEVGYQYINPEEQKRRILLSASHRSMRNGPTGNELSAQNNQSIGLSLMQPVKNLEFNIQSQTDRISFNYFGIADSLFQDKQALASIASGTLWKTSNMVGVSNNLRDNISINTRLNYQTIQQVQNQFVTEQSIGFMAEINGNIKENFSWRFIPQIDHLMYASSVVDRTRLVSQTPLSSTLRKDKWSLLGGLNWVYDKKSSGNSQQVYFLPKLIFQYDLNKYQSLEVGLKSGIDLNTAYQNSSENLYLDYAFLDYRTEITQFDWFASYKHSILSDHHLQLGVNYLQVQNKSFFIYDSLNPENGLNSNPEAYSLIYDQGSLGQFQLNLSGQGNLTTKLSYEFALRTNNYFLDTLDAAYHLPTFESRWSLNYVPIDKLLISSELSYESGIQFSAVDEIGEIVNLSLAGDYQINDSLHSFIRLENMLNQSNSRYYLYPSSPFLISIGLKALF